MLYRSGLTSIISLVSLVSFSQKKELTAEQLLKNKMPGIVKALPVVVSWDEDDKLIIGRKLHADSISNPFMVNPKTGKESVTPRQERRPESSKRVYILGEDIYYRDGQQPEVKLTSDKMR